MAGNSKKDLRAEARSFSASLSNVYLMKKRDPQTKHLLEKAQQLIDDLLSDSGKPPPTAPQPRTARPGAGMGQLWVKLDELKRENDDLKRHRVERVRSVDEKAGSPKSPKSPKYQNSECGANVDDKQMKRWIAQSIESLTPMAVAAVVPLQTQGEATLSLSSDYSKLKSDNESLQSQVENLQKAVKEHQDVLSKLQDDYRRSKSALEAAQKVAKKAREDTKKSETQLATVKGEYEALKLKQSQTPPPVPATKPQISSPKPKARTETRTTDNRHTENINERCRPSTIAVAYTTLESQQWMDAKEALEEADAQEEEIARFLCDTLMSSYQTCTSVLLSLEQVVQHLLNHPVVAVELLKKCEPLSSCKLSEDVSNLICQKLRASCSRIDTNMLVKMTKENLNRSNRLLSHWSEESLQNYVKECTSLSWQMVIQKPVMKLADKHSRFDSSKHRLWWSCKQSSAQKVNYVFWPALYDYEGGNLMVKAYVHAS